jgi:hypothetical protein
MLRVVMIVADANRLSVVSTSETITSRGRAKSFGTGPMGASRSWGRSGEVLCGEGRNEDVETVDDTETEGEMRVDVRGGVKVPGGYDTDACVG